MWWACNLPTLKRPTVSRCTPLLQGKRSHGMTCAAPQSACSTARGSPPQRDACEGAAVRALPSSPFSRPLVQRALQHLPPAGGGILLGQWRGRLLLRPRRGTNASWAVLRLHAQGRQAALVPASRSPLA